MNQVFNGVCPSCDSECSVVVEHAPGDAIPDTCPFCGASVDYDEVGDGEDSE